MAKSEHRAHTVPNHGTNSPERPGLETRLAFLGLSEDDARRLQALVPDFRPHADEFVDGFYRHLLSFEETARFLQSPELVERLKQLQRGHFESLLEAHWDDDFVQRLDRVGQTHADRGVEPLFFLGAYYQFFEFFCRRILENAGPVDAEISDDLLSVIKAVFLDVGLTLESYFTKLNQELQQALDFVWKANNELRQFARLTSHDLKTPLATAANLCEEALDEFGDQMPAEAGRLVASARDTIFRMGVTIDELLTATAAGETEASEEVVSSAHVIDEALERVRAELPHKRIEVSKDDSLPPIVGNRVWLREAFYNLLSNAVKYGEQEPVRIRIGVEDRETDCIFSIADRGPGIPAEELERVFAPFRRLPQHRDHPGTGLGLYFTKCLVEAQGGSIWVESIPAEGSCFYVRLRRGGAAASE